VRRRAAEAVTVAALLFAGCALSDDAGEPTAGPRKVETTRVEVIENIGKKGSFDPGEIYRRLSPGVVTVISRFTNGSVRADDAAGLGSGFVVDGDGHVATNAHVVSTGFERRGGRLRPAREVYVEFADRNRVRARIVGLDPNADIAVLKIETAGLRLVPLRFADSNDIAVGQPVAAIGSPFGEEQSLSVGVVSAVDRDIQSLNERFGIGNAIQTDAAINRGNSGGPLLNSRGQVIGVNAQIRSSSGGGEGVGFAIPVETVKRSVEQLREGGRVEYGYLGVATQDLFPQLADRLGLPVEEGALVGEVVNDGPGDKAGLRAGGDQIDFQGIEDIPADGDVVVSVDGEAVHGSSDLAEIVSLKDPGTAVRVELVRDGKRRTVRIELGRRPTELPSR
jgi:S1-C subfamily serine protease